MNKKTNKILKTLEEFEKTEPSFTLELQLSLSELVLCQLENRKWSPQKLAEETGLKESYISRVLDGDANCTLKTVGKLLHALGVRAKIRESEEDLKNT